MTQRPLDAELDDRFESPHTGIPRPFQPQPKIPAAKPQTRPEIPHANDPTYWIVACMWRPVTVADISKFTAIPVAEVERHLKALQEQGKVDELNGVWMRVTEARA